MIRQPLRIATLTVVVPMLLTIGAGQVRAENVEQTVGHGEINWTEKTVTVTGSGAPSLKAPNVAVARLNAERAAKLDALRNIVEAVKGVRVSGTKSAGDAMKDSAKVQSEVEGIVKKFKVLDTKYFSDGGVDVIVQVDLDGVLTETLVPDAGTSVKSAPPSPDVTGIVVNAQGVNLTPAIAPEIVDESGTRLYHAGAVDREAVMKHGVISYNKSLASAMKDSRVGSKPLVIRALKADGAGGSNLIISSADAGKLAQANHALAMGKVIIVTD
ncbi:MAG: LPP20 family lipoprotein [Myxococcota bacterium]